MNHTLNESSIILVTGGGRGVTAHCVIKLAAQYQSHFLLVGRTTIDQPEPNWAHQLFDATTLKQEIVNQIRQTNVKPTPHAVNKQYKQIIAQREIEATITAIKKAGGKATYIATDVTDYPSLERNLTPIIKTVGPINSIIHGAGAIADKLIEQKKSSDFDLVYHTKVTGLENILRFVQPEKLQHLVLFSSVAGFFGNVGQTDYALANEILNKTAHLFKQQYPFCQAQAINWGAWDGGMVTAALKTEMEARGITLISLDEGADFLIWAMQPEQAHIVQFIVGAPIMTHRPKLKPSRQTYRIRRTFDLTANQFLQDHRIGNNPVLPKVSALAWIANSCEQLYPGYSFHTASQFKTLKGIVFDGTETADHFLDIEEVEKAEGSVHLKATIWSEPPGARLRYHFSTNITLVDILPTPPTISSLPTTPLATPAAFYSGSALFHGRSFQGIQALTKLSDKEIIALCRSPKVTTSNQGQIPVQSFNPFAADLFFQLMVIWADHFHQTVGLPLQVATIEQYQPIPFDQPYYLQLQLISFSKSKLLADVTAWDENGRCYLKMSQAQITLNNQLTHQFQNQNETISYVQ